MDNFSPPPSLTDLQDRLKRLNDALDGLEAAALARNAQQSAPVDSPVPAEALTALRADLDRLIARAEAALEASGGYADDDKPAPLPHIDGHAYP